MGSKPSTARHNVTSPSGGVEFYFDPVSPPSRCVHMTLKALGEGFIEKKLQLFKGEHKSEAFLKINPAGQVPAIKDGNFTLGESRAIACYLCNKYNTAASKKLYPTDPMKRAVVDRLLLMSDNLTLAIMKQINLFGVMFNGEQPNEDNLEEAAKALKMCSEFLGNKKFVTGDNVTIADFFLYTPFMLYNIATTDDIQEKFYSSEGGDTVKAWMRHVSSLPYYDEVHKEANEKLGSLYRSKLE